MDFVKNLNLHFSNYGKYIFWSIILGFAIYRSLAWYTFFIKSYDPGFAMDFKNIYIASKNLGLGKNPYSEAELDSTWQRELQTFQTSFQNPPGEIEQPVLYPPWALWMFLPITFVPFASAVQLFYVVLFLSLLISPWLILKCIDGNMKWEVYVSILLLFVGFKGMKLSLLFGQPSIFILALGYGCWYFLKRNNFLIAGVLLGISSIKPSVSIVFYIFLVALWIKNTQKIEKNQVFLTLFLGCLLPAIGLIFALVKDIEVTESIIKVYIHQIQSFTNWFYNRGYDANFYLENTTNLRVLFTFWNIKYDWFLCCVEPILFLGTVIIGIRKNLSNQWTDARFLATLIAASLCFSYHLYYEVAWLVVLYFLFKNEMTPLFQWLVYILCISDFLIGMEKISPYLPTSLHDGLYFWNCLELPLRMMMLWIILLVYPNKNQQVLPS